MAKSLKSRLEPSPGNNLNRQQQLLVPITRETRRHGAYATRSGATAISYRAQVHVMTSITQCGAPHIALPRASTIDARGVGCPSSTEATAHGRTCSWRNEVRQPAARVRAISCGANTCCCGSSR
eukprot:TRINITY_DN22830_c0_g1_i1.p1 TRINITY_DN22830_c0_g1~~TRINITY_DN22830_c0_g1_i1.p1  ORF type:complete len:124 (-),score=14.52 TRINITY_DN22830_c0_g1_i1:191-562(-)